MVSKQGLELIGRSTTPSTNDAAPGTGAARFETFNHDDVRALISAYPLAWVCAGGGASIEASLLPLVGVYDDSGRLTELIGHFMVRNPLNAALSRDPRSTILFRGPDAYISPDHAGRCDWAPTWNYAQLQVGADVRIDPALTEHALAVLIEAMEGEKDRPWSVEALGDRYPAMLEKIVGFRAVVTSLSGRFKLGQDETPETLESIFANLPNAEMVAWMRHFNAAS